MQDSALFSESADDEEPDESWKKAFSIHSSNADQLSVCWYSGNISFETWFVEGVLVDMLLSYSL